MKKLILAAMILAMLRLYVAAIVFSSSPGWTGYVPAARGVGLAAGSGVGGTGVAVGRGVAVGTANVGGGAGFDAAGR